MYFYIVDPQKINQRTFERVQAQLYSCLSEHRITGEITRVTTLRSLPQLVESAFSRGVKTLVAVGSDDTLQELINTVKDREVTIGYIPLAESEIGKILGLNGIETACKSIAARRVEQLDLGLVNGNWFFTRLSFGGLTDTGGGLMSMFKPVGKLPNFEVKFSADGKYNATLRAVAGVIHNARDNSGGDMTLANPTDSILDVMLMPAMSGINLWRYKNDLASGYFENIPGSSLVHLQKIEITSPIDMPLKTGDKVIAKTPAIVEIFPQAVRMIVGRDRTF